MCASGRVSNTGLQSPWEGVLASASTSASVPTGGAKHTLSAYHLRLLDNACLGYVQQYKELDDEFQKDLRRAVNARRKSLFPSRGEWCLQQYKQGSPERQLLCGPNPDVIVFKKITTDQPYTHRRVCYSSSESDSCSSRHCMSYVRVLVSPSDSPIFARIQKLFVHTFAGVSYNMALLSIFEDTHKDEETRLWWTVVSKSDDLVVPLCKLSSPLVVALDHECHDHPLDKLWFLTLQ